MLQLRPIEDKDLPHVLPFLLVASAHERLPGPAATAGYRRHLTTTSQRIRGWLSGPSESPQAVFLAVCPPDGTALVMIAPPGAFGISADAQLLLTQTAMRELDAANVCYTQVLLDPRDAARRALFERCGFVRLTDLVYLERGLAPIDEVEPATHVEWRPYAPTSHADFAYVVQASYVDSLDCPELAGLRPIDAVLAAHQSAGPFDPELWQLACVDGQPAGCILLSRITGAPCAEIVYVGVPPKQRGSGLGRALVQRGIACAARGGASSLLVVVDIRNTVARRLYDRFGFRDLLRRVALWRR